MTYSNIEGGAPLETARVLLQHRLNLFLQKLVHLIDVDDKLIKLHLVHVRICAIKLPHLRIRLAILGPFYLLRSPSNECAGVEETVELSQDR